MKNLTRLVAVFLFVGLVQLFAAAAAPQSAPKGVDAVWAYAGTWSVETKLFDTAQSKAGHEKATLRNACWKDGPYLACNQYVDGVSKVLLVFTFNAKQNVYTSYQIPQGGGESGSGTLGIDGNVWTFPWQVTEAGKTTYFRVVNVWDAPDLIEFRKEFSADNTHWTVTAKGMETKTAAPR